MIAAAAVETRASTAGAPLLRVQNLHKSFGGVSAVSDISLDVASGSIFAIIGPNGAGKSTLLNLISGIYQPDSGSLSFDGHNLSGMPSHRRVRLGLARTFQKIRLFKQLSVLDNVLAGFHVHHKIPAWQYVLHGPAFADDQQRCREEALRLLEFFGMTARLHVFAGVLSYGEQRMLEIARALATEIAAAMRPRPSAQPDGKKGMVAATNPVNAPRIRSGIRSSVMAQNGPNPP
jgi:branched-chain amino acid transport system ATP-binding protein